jgi:2-polyprenyl-6-methoxyphenol hydroxylase-like FAD-dependent oxidoreductase
MGAEKLLETIESRTSGWHPELHNLIRRSDPSTVGVWNIRTSLNVEPWQTTNITLLGDAIHSMTPARGIGANIALRDADLLRRKLIAARDGAPLLRCIEEYETEMRRYGFEAVEQSLQAMQMFIGGAARGAASGASLGVECSEKKKRDRAPQTRSLTSLAENQTTKPKHRPPGSLHQRISPPRLPPPRLSGGQMPLSAPAGL